MLTEKSLCLQDTLTQRLDHWTIATVVGGNESKGNIRVQSDKHVTRTKGRHEDDWKLKSHTLLCRMRNPCEKPRPLHRQIHPVISIALLLWIFNQCSTLSWDVLPIHRRAIRHRKSWSIRAVMGAGTFDNFGG
jgi:hypothetical protein